MRQVTLKFLCTALLAALPLCAGCAKLHGPKSASLDDLRGTFHVLWSDGSAQDHNFTLDQQHGQWLVQADNVAESYPLQALTQAEIESLFGTEAAGKTQCLAWSGEASLLVFCATEPGTKLTARIDDFTSYTAKLTSKTGYFAYLDYLGLWDMEKVKQPDL